MGRKAFGGWDQISIDDVIRAQEAIERDRFLPAMALTRSGETADRLTRYAEYLVPLYRAIKDVTGADVIVDTGKHASAAMVLRRIEGIDLRAGAPHSLQPRCRLFLDQAWVPSRAERRCPNADVASRAHGDTLHRLQPRASRHGAHWDANGSASV